MDQLDEQFRRDATHALREAGEWIRYQPWQEPTIPILAIVDREPASTLSGFKGAGIYKHEIWISRGRDGMATINLGNDYVFFANRIGGEVEKFKVMKVFGPEDAGMWHLGVG